MKLFGKEYDLPDYFPVFAAGVVSNILNYPIRLSFGAAIAVIGRAEGYTTAQLGLVATLLFASYGAAQLISGVLGDRLPPHLLVFGGLLGSGICNLLFALSPSLFWMELSWVLNGVCCAFIWAPMVRFLTMIMPARSLHKGMSIFQYSSAFGMLLTYLGVSLVTRFWPWRTVFFICALLGVAGAFYWLFTARAGLRRCTRQEVKYVLPDENGRKKSALAIYAASGVFIVLALNVCMGFLKDGIQTWVPEAVTATFGTLPSFSVFLSAGLPVVSLLGVMAVDRLYKRFPEDDMLITALMFTAAALFLGLLYFLGGVSAWLTVVLLSLASACVFGANMVLACLLPLRYAPYGRSATVAGLTNAFTYLGSALSGVGLGAAALVLEWRIIFALLAALAALGVGVALIVRIMHKKFFTNQN